MISSGSFASESLTDRYPQFSYGFRRRNANGGAKPENRIAQERVDEKARFRRKLRRVEEQLGRGLPPSEQPGLTANKIFQIRTTFGRKHSQTLADCPDRNLGHFLYRSDLDPGFDIENPRR